MNDEEIDAFLMTGTRTGHLATVNVDGSPHVAPVWFVLDAGAIVFMTHRDTVKGRNLTRDPRAAMTVDDPSPPYAFVLVQGLVKMADIAADVKLAYATQISERYMGADRAEEFGRRNAVPGEFVVRLTPTKRVGQAQMTE